MRIRRLALALVGLLVLAGTSPVSAATPVTATALTLPSPNYGLDQGSLPYQACSSSGNCVLTGMFMGAHLYVDGVLETEVKGVWQTPTTVSVPVHAVARYGVTMSGAACPATGACVVLGQYSTTNDSLPFVESQVKGVWQTPVSIALPSDATSTLEIATPGAIACASAGNCVVVGTYTTDATTSDTHGFVASEVAGVWHRALEVVLPGDANANPFVTLDAVACWTVGSCDAVGSYLDADNVSRALVVPEGAGTWHHAHSPGLPGNANAFAGAHFVSIGCAAGGSCAAVGSYSTVTGAQQPLVALSVAGSWNRSLEVTLKTPAANPETLIYGFHSVACPSAGNCVLAGQYLDASGHYQGFLDDVVKGFAQRATTLPLPSGSVQAGRNGGAVSVSCVAAGSCVVGGSVLNATGNYVAVLVTSTAGAWGPALSVTLPTPATTVGVDGGIYSVQCFAHAPCQVSGSYLSGGRYQGFVTSVAS